MKNNWIVITGGPSTGKTTLLAELEKLGHMTIPEAARAVIDNGIAKGLTVEQIRTDEKKFQDDVMRMKMVVEKSLDSKLITFFDRGMHDTEAYLNYYGYKIDEWIRKGLESAAYKKVFLLDPLPEYTADYARTETGDFAEKIQQLLFDAYKSAGMEPVRVPPVSAKERVQFILESIKDD